MKKQLLIFLALLISNISFAQLDQPIKTTGNGGNLTFSNLTTTSTFTNGNWLVGSMLSANTTETFTTNQTIAQINSIITSYPRNLNNKTLTFIFSAGTYPITTTLTFYSFFGGSLVIRGPSSITGKSTNQTAIISTMTTSNYNPIKIFNCSDVIVNNLMFDFPKDTAYPFIISKGLSCRVQSCYFKGRGTDASYGIIEEWSGFIYLEDDVFENIYGACFNRTAIMSISTCSQTNTPPGIGVLSGGGLTIRKDSEILGTTDNSVGSGGLLVTSAGKILP